MTTSSPHENKKFRVTKEELELLKFAKLRQDKDYKAQMKFNRELQKARLEADLRIIDRVINFKQNQLKNGQLLEVDETKTDKFKQPFELQNEIDRETVNRLKVVRQLEELESLVKEEAEVEEQT